MSFKPAVHLDAPVETVFEMFKNPANWQQFAGKGLVYRNEPVMAELQARMAARQAITGRGS